MTDPNTPQQPQDPAGEQPSYAAPGYDQGTAADGHGTAGQAPVDPFAKSTDQAAPADQGQSAQGQQAGYDQGGYGQSAGYGQQQPGYDQQQPGYDQGSYGQPGDQTPAYGAAGAAGYGTQQTAYPQAGYPQAGYPQAGYPQAGYGNYATQGAPGGPSKGLAIGALVVGIIALLGSWIPFVGFFFAFLGLVAIVLGIVGVVQAGKGRAGGKGMAITGAVLGVVSIIVSIVSVVLLLALANSASTGISDSLESIESSISEDGGFGMSSDTEAILAENLDVEFGTFEVTGDPDFPDTNLPVTLTNKGDVAATFSVNLAAVAGGTEVDSYSLFTDTIQPGESVTLESFTFVLDAEQVQGATFEVTGVTMFEE